MAAPSREKDSEVLRQLNDVWENAKVQFEELRDAVVRSSQLAKTKLDTTFLRRERDKLLHKLGDELMKGVDSKAITAPAALKPTIDAIRGIDEKIASEQQEVDAILREGEEAARQAQAKRASRKKSK